MRVDAQPALILHARSYRETSLLLECLTPDHGRVGLVARGVRRERSRLPRGLLQPLQPLHLGWSGNGELLTLTQAEASAAPLPLRGERLYSAMYLNELVLRLCARGDPHGDLFDHYLLCLQRLAHGEPEGWTLRTLRARPDGDLGYGIVLDRDCEPARQLDADAETMLRARCGPANLAWRERCPADQWRGLAAPCTRPHAERAPIAAELRRLMRVLLQHQLGGGSVECVGNERGMRARSWSEAAR